MHMVLYILASLLGLSVVVIIALANEHKSKVRYLTGEIKRLDKLLQGKQDYIDTILIKWRNALELNEKIRKFM